MFLDFMAVRFNPEGADDLEVKINLDFTDTKEQFVLSLDNSVLNNIPNKQDKTPMRRYADARHVQPSGAGAASFPKEIVKGNVKVGGNPLALMKVFSRLDEFPNDFKLRLIRGAR